MSRVDDKKLEIEEYLNDLEVIMPSSFDEYIINLEKRLACERALEKIIEAISDLAILIIKDKRLKIPTDDLRAFDVLAEKKIISKELSDKLKQAKGMRNFLAHQYSKIDDKIIFGVLRDSIMQDVNEFLKEVKND